MPTENEPVLPAYTIIDLGTLGGSISWASGINNAGWVTGGASISGDTETHAFLYDGERMHDLGTLGGDFCAGYGINNLGNVVGHSRLTNGTHRAFLYTAGRMIDLNTVLPEGSDCHLHFASDINDNGWITATGTIKGRKRAFLLRPA